MKKTLLTGLVVGTMMFGMLGVANATIITYDQLEGGSGDVLNVLFNGIDDINFGTTVTGHLMQTGDLVNFMGNEMLFTTAIGQARIEAVDGEFTWLKIWLDDPTKGFEKIQFNLDFANNGEVSFSILDQYGTAFDSTWDVNGNGQNWFTAIGLDGQVMTSITIQSTGATISGINDIQQIRIGPADIPNNVPEPATMFLFGTGLAGLAGLRFRNKKS